jgi:acetyl coenzyme A synthetase (ADP forming)-like protein
MLEKMFYPESVAVIGASADPRKLGHTVLKNIVDGGFKGRIYPINPKGGEILDLKAYQSVLDVPDEVDLAVIIVPAKFVPGVMEDLGKKGVKAAIIITGGFREASNEELEEQVLEIAGKYGIRVVGPNCQGINNTHHQLCASWPLITLKGRIAIASQSGTVAAALADWSQDDGIGFSTFVSLGNKSDVDEVDIIEFFSEDDNTAAIALYIEGVRDGRRFMDAARKCRKPIVVLKPGVTERGAKAVESHTKSMAGRDAVFEAACRQSGIVRAENLEELYDFAKAFAYLRPFKGERVLIVTSSGGSGILAIDVLESNGLKVFEADEELKAKLRELVPAHAILDNPIDLTGDATAEMYLNVVKAAFDYADAFLLIVGDPIEGAADTVIEVVRMADEAGKTVVVAFLGGAEVEKEEVAKMHSNNIPVFPTPERAAKVLAALKRWGH